MHTYATYPSLKNRGVFITGGASGIGAALVKEFCAQGSQVAFVDINAEAGENLVTEISDNKPLFFQCDLRDISALKTVIKNVIELIPSLQVLINNAANDTRHHTLDVSEQEWHDLMAINLNHYFFAAQALLPNMIKAGSGSIINLSSNCYLLGQMDDYPVYMTAKAAITGLTRALAKEFGPHNIRVNTILPGWVMTERQIEQWLTPEAEADLLKTQALPQKIYPEHIARVALFLAADDSQMCTKQAFVVDAGRV